MKKIILSLALSGVISFVSAQTTSGQGAGNTQSSPGAVKKTNKKNGAVTATDTISNRKVYKSKKTGQAATRTGQEAAGTNSSHAPMPKNAGRKVE